MRPEKKMIEEELKMSLIARLVVSFEACSFTPHPVAVRLILNIVALK